MNQQSTMSTMNEPSINNVNDNQSHIFHFIEQLKKYESRDIVIKGLKITKDVVVSIDKDLFVQTLTPGMEKYNPALADWDRISSAFFLVGKVWASRHLISHVIALVSNLHGWQPTKNRYDITCNQKSTPSSEHKTCKQPCRQFKSGQLKTGCDYSITLRPLEFDRELRPTTSKTKWRYTPNWNSYTVTEKAFLQHTKGCTPSLQNKLSVSSPAGNYQRLIPS